MSNRSEFFSLEALPARSRFTHFRDVADSLYVPVSLETETPEDFHHWDERRDFGGIRVGKAQMSNVTVMRTPREIARTEADGEILVVVPLSGAIGNYQDKQETLTQPGQFFISDPSRPYDFKLFDATYLYLLIPPTVMRSKLHKLDASAGMSYGSEQPYSKLARDFILSLSSVWDSVSESAASHLSTVALDLITSAIYERRHDVATPGNVYRSAQFARAKAVIDEHIQYPGLSVSLVAAALCVSTRYLGSLMQEQGFSYRRYVLAQRLEGSARDLRDPRLLRRSITEIAYAWAFANSAHFSRAFKAAYAMSPRDYRASTLGR